MALPLISPDRTPAGSSHSSILPGRAAVVAPYGSGRHYPSEFADRGWDCVAVTPTDDALPPLFRGSLDPTGYRRVVVHDGNVDGTARALSGVQGADRTIMNVAPVRGKRNLGSGNEAKVTLIDGDQHAGLPVLLASVAHQTYPLLHSIKVPLRTAPAALCLNYATERLRFLRDADVEGHLIVGELLIRLWMPVGDDLNARVDQVKAREEPGEFVS